MYTMSSLSDGESENRTIDNVFRSLQIEYIQSLLISKKDNFKHDIHIDASLYQETFYEIDHLFQDILSSFQLLPFVWGSQLLQEKKYDDETVNILVEMQSLYLVRGSRYQHNELTLLSKLIKPHDSKIKELFDLDSSEVIEGAKYLQYQLSQKKADNINEFIELVDSGMSDPEESRKDDLFLEKFGRAMNLVMGLEAYCIDDKLVWNKKLIDEFTCDMASDISFMNESDIQGSLYSVLPIIKYPFLRIDSKIYCLSYYTFFDHLYRNLRRIVLKNDPTYLEKWNIEQSKASESFVAEIFSELIPFSNIYCNNYYRIKGKGNTAENDIIVIIDNVLFVVEVKGSSFPLKSVMNDEISSIESYKKLIGEADQQSQRFIDLLNINNEIQIYDKYGKKKFLITKSDFKYIYPISISIADINDMASKAEKLPFLTANAKSICLSIDDLLLYKDYFDNYLNFLHYIKHRYFALKLQSLHVNDELDHLGLYIEHNYYSMTFGSRESDKVFVNGYRDKLDFYFQSKYFPERTVIKPEQKLPSRIDQILDYLKDHKKKNSIIFADSVLDLNDEGRDDFSKIIDYIIERQTVNKKMSSAIQQGESTFIVYVYQDGIMPIDNNHKDKYNCHTLYSSNSESLFVLNLIILHNKLEVLSIEELSKSALDFTQDEINSLNEYMEPWLKHRKIISMK